MIGCISGPGHGPRWESKWAVIFALSMLSVS